MRRLHCCGPRLALMLLAVTLASGGGTGGREERQLRFCLRSEPRTLDPLWVTEESSDSIRYLTQGTLLRVNRMTQEAEPELAVSWKTARGGSRVSFQLRKGVRFSNGSPFDSRDVRFTIERLLDPVRKVPAGEALRSVARVAGVETPGPHEVTIQFAAPVANLEGLFDEIPIIRAGGTGPQAAVLGPFQAAESEPGSYLLLRRNGNYWKKDAQGRALPYLDSIRIDIQQNRDLELARFRRGELHFITSLEAASFERLAKDSPGLAVDAGTTLDAEMLWFNQSARAPLPAHKKSWFRSRAFRQAVNAAISREALVRLAWRGAAREAFGPISPAAAFWRHPRLRPVQRDLYEARRLLAGEGFKTAGGRLRDAWGNPVEFSVITNSGNKARAQMAALIQQDLAQAGIRLNIVPLDMASVVERIAKSLDYEACLLGLVGAGLDPLSQASLWMSSSATHQWNPSQTTPETPWEAEIDGLMRALSEIHEPARRKKAADRLQEIAAFQLPVIYLVHPSALVAVSRELVGARPVALRPRVFWNVERLDLAVRAPRR